MWREGEGGEKEGRVEAFRQYPEGEFKAEEPSTTGGEGRGTLTG